MLHAITWESTVRSQLLEAPCIGDTVSYPFREDKTPVLQTLKERHFPGLFDMLEAEGMSHAGRPHGSLRTVLRSNVRTNPLQSVYSQAGETNVHYVTAADALEHLPPRDGITCLRLTTAYNECNQLPLLC